MDDPVKIVQSSFTSYPSVGGYSIEVKQEPIYQSESEEEVADDTGSPVWRQVLALRGPEDIADPRRSTETERRRPRGIFRYVIF